MGIVECMHGDPWEAIVRSVTTRATRAPKCCRG